MQRFGMSRVAVVMTVAGAVCALGSSPALAVTQCLPPGEEQACVTVGVREDDINAGVMVETNQTINITAHVSTTRPLMSSGVCVRVDGESILPAGCPGA